MLHVDDVTSPILAVRAAIARSSEVPRKAKVGRPKLPKGKAKGRIVPVRFNVDDIKAIERAARESKQTLSEWIRSTLNAAITR